MHIFKSNIDIDKNEAKNFRLQNEIAFPSLTGTDKGFIFFHSAINTFYGWDGSSWLNLVGGSPYTLPTATDTILGGVKIDGTTITIDGGGVISSTLTNSGFEQVTENGITGWRWIGEAAGDDVNRYRIGYRAIDGMIFDGGSVGQPDFPALPFGSKSSNSVHFGLDNKDNSLYSAVILGSANQTNAYAYAIMIGGFNNIGYGYGDVCIGSYNTTTPTNVNSFLFAMGHNNTMSASRGGVALGIALRNKSRGSCVVGTANVLWAGAEGATDRPMFTVGIGTTTTPAGRWAPLVPKDGLNVKINGQVIADSLTTALINSESTGRVLVTKEWVKPKYLVNATVTGTYDIDWNYDTLRLTMTGATTFSDINLPTSGTNTKVLTIYMNGSFTPTWPAGWTTNMIGTYDGTVLNQIVVEFISTGVYWVTINRAD